jgi:uncharacterized protein YdhG (YjbR/CyaY superfamily)
VLPSRAHSFFQLIVFEWRLTGIHHDGVELERTPLLEQLERSVPGPQRRVRVPPVQLFLEERSAKSTTASSRKSKGWTAEERAAAKAYAQELKAEARGANDEKPALAAIAAMPQKDRTMGKRLHEIVKASAPDLAPKTWYGMPAYAKEGKVVCFFQSADKFKARYATLGFNDTANLDDGAMWPTAFALKELTPAVEAKIGELVKNAVR